MILNSIKCLTEHTVLTTCSSVFRGNIYVLSLIPGFVKAVGEEPTEYLKKYYGQVPVIHLKDYTGADSGDGTQSGTRDCPLGQGIQDIPAILDESVNCYVRYVVVEQDDPNELDEIEAAKQSRDYLRSLGW